MMGWNAQVKPSKTQNSNKESLFGTCIELLIIQTLINWYLNKSNNFGHFTGQN